MGMNGSTGDFESLAKQYWNTWNELLGRGGGSGLDAFGLAGAMPPGIGRMDPGAFDWYAKMQQLAMQFSGQQPSASDVTRAWREMLGVQAANPFAGMLHGAQGGPLFGSDWVEQVRPWLDGVMRQWRTDNVNWLQMPAFGPQREHQERLKRLVLAWQEWQERNQAFLEQLSGAGQQAFVLFEQRLGARDTPGERIETARALFDLWIDAAEEAWAEIALTADFRHAYAEMTNAQMRLRLGVQREIEQIATLFGLPSRTEVDAVHRKVADLERALHAARRAGTAGATTSAPRERPVGERVPSQAAAAAAPREPAAEKKPASASRRRKAASAATPAAKRAKPAGKAATAKAAAPRTAARAAATKASVVDKPAAQTSRSAKAAPSPATAKTPAARKRSAAASRPDAGQAAATAQAAKTPDAGRSAKPAAVKKAAAGSSKPATRKPAAAGRKAAARKKAAPAGTALPNVVSMKDWVTRNLEASPDAATRVEGAAARGKRGGRRK